MRRGFRGSIAVASECLGNHLRVAVGRDGGATQVTLTLLAHATGQMAGASLAVLRLAVGRQAEAFFGAFVGFLLRHDRVLLWGSPLFADWILA